MGKRTPMDDVFKLIAKNAAKPDNRRYLLTEGSFQLSFAYPSVSPTCSSASLTSVIFSERPHPGSSPVSKAELVKEDFEAMIFFLEFFFSLLPGNILGRGAALFYSNAWKPLEYAWGPLAEILPKALLPFTPSKTLLHSTRIHSMWDSREVGIE